MAAVINLTNGAIRVIANTKQPLHEAIDVSAFDSIDLLLSAYTLEGTSSPQAQVQILTGMQKDTEDGWVSAFAFATTTTAPTFTKDHITGLLRFVRWEVLNVSGTNPALTFALNGMARQGV